MDSAKKANRILILAIVALIIPIVILWIQKENMHDVITGHVPNLESELVQKDSMLRAKNMKIKALEEALAELDVPGPTAADSGIWFEVQLGSFTDFDLDEYIDELVQMRQEKEGSNAKLLLGRFRSIKPALLFENDMHRLGLKDAYVVGRINGEIVDAEVALKAIERQNKP